MIWRTYQAISTTALTALITMIALLYTGMDPDSAAFVGICAGVVLTSVMWLKDNDND